MTSIGGVINRVSGQTKAIDNFKATVESAKADGNISRAEFSQICNAMNDIWKLNRPEVMGWLAKQDSSLHEALRYGQAGMSQDVGWNHYTGNE